MIHMSIQGFQPFGAVGSQRNSTCSWRLNIKLKHKNLIHRLHDISKNFWPWTNVGLQTRRAVGSYAVRWNVWWWNWDWRKWNSAIGGAASLMSCTKVRSFCRIFHSLSIRRCRCRFGVGIPFTMRLQEQTNLAPSRKRPRKPIIIIIWEWKVSK